jgi:hypothetical protein
MTDATEEILEANVRQTVQEILSLLRKPYAQLRLHTSQSQEAILVNINLVCNFKNVLRINVIIFLIFLANFRNRPFLSESPTK